LDDSISPFSGSVWYSYFTGDYSLINLFGNNQAVPGVNWVQLNTKLLLQCGPGDNFFGTISLPNPPSYRILLQVRNLSNTLIYKNVAGFVGVPSDPCTTSSLTQIYTNTYQYGMVQPIVNFRLLVVNPIQTISV